MAAALFELGRVMATPGAIEAFSEAWRTACLIRHVSGDWSEMDPEDAQANRDAIHSRLRVFSSYTHPRTKERLWCITEADRSLTVMLLPSEY